MILDLLLYNSKGMCKIPFTNATIYYNILITCVGVKPPHNPTNHQISKPPAQDTKEISPNERGNVVPMMIPTFLTPRILVGMSFDATKS
jgi:hypothetical protein